MSTPSTSKTDPPIALVTGGGTGIGAAIAGALAGDGFDVVITGRRPDPLKATAAHLTSSTAQQVRAIPMDVTDDVAVRAVVGDLPRLDVLVNNAGGAIGLGPVESASVDEWQAMYAANVLGTLRVTQAALPLLRDSPRATIVTITSIAGERTYDGGGGYTAAKHAERAMVETLRSELNGEHIRVVDIRPGMVHTEEFSLTRFHGDRDAADKVYAGVDRPLIADDIAGCVSFAVGAPQHVNIDSMVIKPVAQATPQKLHRGPIDWKTDDNGGAS